MSATLLIEIGTEELPVKALPGLAQAFTDGVVAALRARQLIDHDDARTFYTPRRLAVQVRDVASRQPEQRSELLGPYVNIALDADGNPTRALQGFAQKNGVEWTALERTTDAKGERFVFRSVSPGADAASLLPEVIDEAVRGMPIPKPMRWGEHDYAFARPVHWLVVLLGEQIVDAVLMGASADRMSRGHRFHHPKPVWISRADDYVDALRAAKVLADADERRERIRAQVADAAHAAGGVARIDDGILDEVSCLTEWPAAVPCRFERAFLEVPAEALISTMETNQKFFPVLDADGVLTEHFVGVANVDSRDPDEIRRGYERVIRPRFADARFFFDADRAQPLSDYVDALGHVTYQQKLGTLADKVGRVASLARAIAPQIGVDADLAERAARLSKFDLMTRMVGEFPELQGTMGRYYAAAAGEPAEVANAIDEAYMPRFAGDAIAPSPLGRVLAVAERLDTLAGGFAAGLKPSGNKDPFALRRNALGLARTLIEGGIDLDLTESISQAVRTNPAPDATRVDDIVAFVIDRLRSYYGDEGAAGLQFDAVAAMRPASLTDFDARLKAIRAFASMPEAEPLAAANKRIRNILRKAEDAVPDTVDASLLQPGAEADLAAAIDAAIADTDGALAARDYVAVLQRLAQLREPVDAFFDQAMVMADDEALRRNRLALLARLSDRFLAVADVSVLASG